MINWGAFLGLLYKHRYDGTLSIEPHSRTWSGEQGDWGVRFTAEYISKMIY
jgi:sugar phosphate isomerase/epimerase